MYFLVFFLTHLSTLGSKLYLEICTKRFVSFHLLGMPDCPHGRYAINNSGPNFLTQRLSQPFAIQQYLLFVVPSEMRQISGERAWTPALLAADLPRWFHYCRIEACRILCRCLCLVLRLFASNRRDYLCATPTGRCTISTQYSDT